MKDLEQKLAELRKKNERIQKDMRDFRKYHDDLLAELKKIKARVSFLYKQDEEERK